MSKWINEPISLFLPGHLYLICGFEAKHFMMPRLISRLTEDAAPAARISSHRARALPASHCFERKVCAREMRPVARRVNIRSARKGRRLPLTVAQVIDHHLCAARELHAEPVPSLLVRGRAPCAEFAIHPGRASEMLRLAVPGDSAFCRHAREREV